MTDAEIKAAWWRIFMTRRFLDPIPEELAPVGALVHLAIGRYAELIGWLDANPNEGSPVAHKRLAYVLAVDGPNPGTLHGLVEEDEVVLVQRQERPQYLTQFLGVIQ